MFKIRKKALKLMLNSKPYRAWIKQNEIGCHTLGYLLEDEEQKDFVYFVPWRLEELQEQKAANHDLTSEAFPVRRSFLEEVDSMYIDEESDRDFFRNELQKYDDRTQSISNRAASRYKSGKINKAVYNSLKSRLESVESEALSIEVQLKTRKAMNRNY